MKKIILILFVFLNFCFAYDPTAAANEEEAANPGINSSDPASVRVYKNKVDENPDIPDFIKRIEADNQAKKEEKEKERAEEISKVMEDPVRKKEAMNLKYFESYWTFENAALSCPPLIESVRNRYFVLLEDMNFKTGQIVCGVYEIPNLSVDIEVRDATPFKTMSKIYEHTFTNEKYVKILRDFDKMEKSNYLEDEAIAAAEIFAERIKYSRETMRYKFNNMSSSYSDVFKSTNASTQFLDLSDAIDNVLVFNTNILDLESSYNQGTLVFKDDYFVNYSNPDLLIIDEENKQFITDLRKELNQRWNIFPSYEAEPEYLVKSQSDVAQILGSKLQMIIYFIINFYHQFQYFFNIFIIGAIAYSVYHIAEFAFQFVGKNRDEKKQLSSKLLFNFSISFFILTMTWTHETDKIDVDNNTLSISRSNLQTLLNWVALETNDMADGITEAINDSYIGSMYPLSTTSIEGAEAIGRQLHKNNFIFDVQTKYFPQCYNIWNTELIKSENVEFFEKNPTSSFLPDSLVKKDRLYSPYTKQELGGWLRSQPKLDLSKYSLSACASIEKQYAQLKWENTLLERQIDAFNDIELKELMSKQKELIMERVWLNYFKNGYLAAPTIALMNSYEKIMTLPQRKSQEWAAILTNADSEQTTAFLLDNSILALTIGSHVQEVAASVTKIGTDATFGWVPFIGSAFSSATSEGVGWVTAILTVDLLEDLIPAIRGIWIWAISSVWFFVMFVAKFAVYWTLPLLLVYAFATQNAEKVSKQIVRIVVTFSKPIIFIFVLFLTIFAMDFFHEYANSEIQNMFESLKIGGSIFEYGSAALLKGVALILSIFLELVMAYEILVNGTKTLISGFDVVVNDLADAVT
ncbi:MAG: hypothetical protein PHS65_09320, partial [Arcobacteraceae bacterium]|nr:hypothetical protein [Arcobacteraceae bacterium]